MNKRLLCTGTFLMVTGLFFLLFRVQAISPRIGDALCQFGEEEPNPCTIPLRIRSDAPILTIRFSLEALERYPESYHFTLAGCLEGLSVDGVIVKEDIPFCDDGMGRVLNLSSTLHEGKNTLIARINHGSSQGNL